MAEPSIAHPTVASDRLAITWVGHATFLIQVDGVNVLTDPMWSRRASPVQWAGPARFVPPGVDLEALPPVDAALVSHDHYDHLDDATVRTLVGRSDGAIRWFIPPGHGAWFEERGVLDATELGWWDEAAVGPARIVALPCRHWSNRNPLVREGRGWCSWGILTPGWRVYFGGDSAYFDGFAEIGERAGPFDAALLPIGAYEPRWFMAGSHMNPEEAVRAYLDLGGRGAMVAAHWGTFRLTDEDPLEPPVRARSAWSAAGLPSENLWILRHGETRQRRST